MAMETTALHAAPAAQVIGNAFVEQYYQIQHHSPELSINDMICSLGYKNYKAEIKTADAQQSYKDGVIVLVTGKDNIRKQFTQTFFLAPQDKGYFVLNDVLRLIILSNCTDFLLHVLDPPNHGQTSSHAEEIQIVEEVVHGSLEDEKLVGAERETVVGADSHINENHTSENAQPATSVAQEDAPKKSYALILVNSVARAPIPESSISTASGGNVPESKDARYGLRRNAEADECLRFNQFNFKN
ncbi:hypothetical protein K7X08_019343 [Anisodus acutangulus]|uniref:NTF2 domain-containing protein n=1 Tax=Anisodus acutangulus TaxID=402998 RepID=A0A9Q1RPQ2_9SOLA|nr:hypothetical protein K7X08_019343 [Anisodus acutangulus]